MSQLVYHPAIIWSTSGDHHQQDPPPLVLVQTTTELCGQKTSCGSHIKAEFNTGGNANVMLIDLDLLSFKMQPFARH